MSTDHADAAATPSRDDRLAALKSVVGGVLTLARATDRAARPRLRQTHAVLGVLAIAAGARQWRTGPGSPVGPRIGAGYVVAFGLALRSGREERDARRASTAHARHRAASGPHPPSPDGRDSPGRGARLAGTSTAVGGLIDLARALERGPDDERTWLSAIAASTVLAGVGEALGRPRLRRLGLASALVSLATLTALVRE